MCMEYISIFTGQKENLIHGMFLLQLNDKIGETDLL